ncbi:HAMP domain-containing sensor histidine kinase [Streptacidiphilus sp. N1-10]|uniref:histidine kinase n=1 Tax=Streptacidiphilus jeojiensis TaxID=3229225 RepID=A0ABV6XHF2_9ACTN
MAVTSFRSRVVALTVLVATTVVAVLVVLSHVLLSRVTDADAHAMARTRAEAAAANIAVEGGRVVMTENGSEALDSVAWVYADGQLVDGFVPTALLDQVQALSGSPAERTAVVQGHLLLARPVPTAGHRTTVVVGVDLMPYETSERHSLTASLILGALAVLLAALVADFAVRRSLRVVHEMAALADDWGDHEPGRRFDLGVPRDEFGELGGTLDRLLDRIDHVLEEERRLSDEIAHELRTPLTVLRGEAQLAQLSGQQLPPGAVLREVERLNSAITTILGAARRRVGGGDRCDLAAAARAVIAGRGVELDVAAGVEVAVPAEVVTAVLAPLLDNGLRHARARVRVTARTEAGVVLAEVLDDGPGFAAEEVERVFEAGVSAGTGHGLGLAVARRVAASAGVEIRAVAVGHGRVEVLFPAPRAAT